MPVHICTGTVAIVHKCTIMHKLMCVFFFSNCVKLVTFSILHNYGRADVIALSICLDSASSVCQWVTCTVYRTHKPLFSVKFLFKNKFHGTIHTFKNYFVTVFSIFSFQ